MKLNKLAAGAVMALAMGTSASAMTYDFNVGIGGGINSPLFLAPYDQSVSSDTQATSWQVGGFLGFGFMLDIDTMFSNAIGLEYSVAFRGDYIAGDVIELISANADNSFQMGTLVQNFDVYYKLGLVKGKLPMDLQFNVGLAYRLLLDYEFNTTVFKPVTANLYGFGVHTGFRFNVHMVYLAMDYSYIPSVIDGSVPNPANSYLINEHTVGLTVGLILNKTILDTLMGK